MVNIYYCTVFMVCINLGNSLGNTRNQLPSKERFNFFDTELLQVLNQKEKKNMLISPISIKILLGMLMEGAENSTAEEIRAALRLPHDEEARRAEFNTLFTSLQRSEAPNVLKIANRVFLSNRYAVDPDYGKTLKKHYSSEITRVKFEEPKETSRTINDWVGNQTSRGILRIVEEDQIHPNHQLMLMSAVYFKGLWARPFASERNVVKCFYSNDHICQETPMMTDTGYFDYGYISRLNVKAIMLPYKGGKFSMLLLLPLKEQSVELLGRDLVHVSFSSILSEMREEEVFVQIPQFEISYNDDLAESLKKLQISQIFDHRAKLLRMLANYTESPSVNRIYHSAKITVNEEGSEAAAATGALFVPLMGGTTKSFIANRPFYFFVMNAAKNSILFAGKVVRPLTSESSNSTNLLTNKIHNFLQENLITPLPFRKNDSFQRNSSEEIVKSTELSKKHFHEIKHIQRGQSAGPKFRFIKPLLPVSREYQPSSLTRGNSANFNNSLFHPPLSRILASQQKAFEKETQKFKRGKTPLELSRAHKRPESLTDDWRHHVLFFT